jgi:hypothetical protein
MPTSEHGFCGNSSMHDIKRESRQRKKEKRKKADF